MLTKAWESSFYRIFETIDVLDIRIIENTLLRSGDVAWNCGKRFTRNTRRGIFLVNFGLF